MVAMSFKQSHISGPVIPSRKRVRRRAQGTITFPPRAPRCCSAQGWWSRATHHCQRAGELTHVKSPLVTLHITLQYLLLAITSTSSCLEPLCVTVIKISHI